MIIYFANRYMSIMGVASTDLPDAYPLQHDKKTIDIDSGVATFEMELVYTDSTHLNAKELVAAGNYILRYHNDDYEVYTIIETEDDTEKGTIYLYAEDAGLDLLNEYLLPYTATEAKSIAWYIEKFARDSGFEIGLNEISNLTRKLSWDSSMTAAERIRSVATQFDAELGYSFDIDKLQVKHKYIDIYKRRGRDTQMELRLGREVKKIVEQTSIANIATCLRVTGGTPEGSNTPINLIGYTYDDGDIYIDQSYGDLKSRTALEKWSRYLSETGTGDGHIVGQYSYDTTSQAELCAHAVSELKKRREPAINYDVDMYYLPTELKIGDDVRIIDDGGELYLSARLLQTEEQVTDDIYKATFGDFLIKSSGISEMVQELAEKYAELAKTRTLYTWIAYADDASGTNISTDPTGKAYIGIAVNRVDATPDLTDPTVYAWSAIDGGAGPAGTSFRNKGAWAASTAYVSNSSYIDVVSYDGNSYACITSHTSGSTFDSSKWTLMAAKGEDGDTPVITGSKSGDTTTIYSDGTQIAQIVDGAEGDDGTTFTPSVDTSGNISWTNDGGKTNPTTRNIKGPQGDAGPEALVTIEVTAINYVAGTATLKAVLRVNGTVTTPTAYKWTKGTSTTSLGTSQTLSVTSLNEVYHCTCTWSGGTQTGSLDLKGLKVAGDDAKAAMTSASGKNTIYRAAVQPSSNLVEGDVWFDSANDNKIYRYTNGAWTAVALGDDALDNLSANKITTGTLDASQVTVSNLDAGNITTGTLNADRIGANSLTLGKMTTEAQAAIDNSAIQIGGRNLLAGTQDFSGSTVLNATVGSDVYEKCKVASYTKTDTTSYVDFVRWEGISVESGTYYTLSFWAKASAAISVGTYFYANAVASGYGSQGQTTTAADGYMATTLSTSWVRYWYTWKTSSSISGTKTALPIRIPAARTGTVYLAGVMFEQSNKASDWTPAPEDIMNAAIDGVQTEGANLIINSDRFDKTVDPYKNSTATEYSTYYYGERSWYCSGPKYVQIDLPKLIAGETYILSFDITRSSAENVFATMGGVSTNIGTAGAGVWKRLSYTFTATEASENIRINVYTYSSTGTANFIAAFKNFKLERGTTATDWTPAAQDGYKVATNYLNFDQSTGLDVGYSGTNAKTRINGSGVEVYDGSGVKVASYGSEVILGDATKAHQKLDYHSMQLIDKEGALEQNPIPFFYVSDLRDSAGYATITERYWGDGITKDFDTSYAASSIESVTIGGIATSDYTSSPLSDYTRVTFTTAPANASEILITYKTTNRYAKAYTAGIRNSDAKVGAMSFAEGYNNAAMGTFSHAEGKGNVASGRYSHAEGNGTIAASYNSHSEGEMTEANGSSSHAEGYKTVAESVDSHAEGYFTTASGSASHAEGQHTTAVKSATHSEGYMTTASGTYSHAEGNDTTASGDDSHAGGKGTIADRPQQTVVGMYNKTTGESDGLFVVGNGASDSSRSNALKVTRNGEVCAAIGAHGPYVQAVGTASSQNLSGTSVTQVTLATKSIKYEPDSDFTISSGGVMCNKAGTYRITASAYVVPVASTNHVGTYVKVGTAFSSATEVMGTLTATAGQTIERGVGLVPKLVSITAGQIVFLAARTTSAQGTVQPNNAATYLLIERIA